MILFKSREVNPQGDMYMTTNATENTRARNHIDILTQIDNIIFIFDDANEFNQPFKLDPRIPNILLPQIRKLSEKTLYLLEKKTLYLLEKDLLNAVQANHIAFKIENAVRHIEKKKDLK